MIKFTTNFGDIIIEVNHEKAPISAKNFEQYVRHGFYDGLIFHRVISNFMIQGGGFLPDMVEKETRESIQNEADNGLPNANGTLAMARTTAPHSASSQFFINVADNRFLDFPGQDGWGYCVFGRVIEGMDIVEKIKAVATTTRMGHGDVPVDDVMIEKAEVMD